MCRSLADIDHDGQLTCEEFVLAMHLCDLAKAGKELKSPLPPDLLPPTFVKKTRQNSITSVGSNDGGTPVLTSPQGKTFNFPTESEKMYNFAENYELKFHSYSCF